MMLLTIERDVVRFAWVTHHDLRGQSDEVNVEGLGDEGKRPGRPEIALDDLNHVSLGQQLDVEGTGDVQGLRDLAGDLFNRANRLHIQFLRR